MNKINSIEDDKRRRILRLLPELDRRYAVLRGLLEQARDEQAIDEVDLRLAQCDVQAVLMAMQDGDVDTDDDDAY